MWETSCFYREDSDSVGGDCGDLLWCHSGDCDARFT